MGGFQCLTEESYEQLKKLNRNGLISEKAYREIEDCVNLTQLKKILSNHLQINEKEMPPILWYIFTELCSNDRDDHNTLNIPQSKFIKQLLINNGIYTRDDCQRKILTNQ